MGCASDKTLALANRSVAGSGAILIAEAFTQLSRMKALTRCATGRRTGGREVNRVTTFASLLAKASVNPRQEETAWSKFTPAAAIAGNCAINSAGRCTISPTAIARFADESAPAERHIWTDSRLPWLHLDEHLPGEAEETL